MSAATRDPEAGCGESATAALVMAHHGVMATPGRYLTLRGICGMAMTAALDRARCVRRGHDPVAVGSEMWCRRCLHAVRRR